MQSQIFELQYALDTFYLLISGVLVMWMAAGFTMLETGLVRSKNTVEILTKNVSLFAVSCTMYMMFGYAIMYGGELFLKGITGNEVLVADALMRSSENGFNSDSISSKAADFFFQVTFVATCMSIVSGAVAERMKLWSFLLFAVFMTALIYPIGGSWVWGNKDVLGLFNLSTIGFSDFAGAGVVHMAGSAAALSGVLLLGARKGKYGSQGEIRAIPGANLPLAALGMLILWMGWFGFNGGSLLKISDIVSANTVAMVFLNTNAAAAGGAIGALVLARIIFGKADLTMTLNGALAGLVTITAEPSTPSALQATLFGLAAGNIVVLSILAIDKMRIDDPVGAISVHGVSGFIGIMLVPITNPEATFIGQLVGAVTIFSWVYITSLLVWLAIKTIMGLRISEEGEYRGADLEECGMEAYPEFTK